MRYEIKIISSNFEGILNENAFISFNFEGILNEWFLMYWFFITWIYIRKIKNVSRERCNENLTVWTFLTVNLHLIHVSANVYICSYCKINSSTFNSSKVFKHLLLFVYTRYSIVKIVFNSCILLHTTSFFYSIVKMVFNSCIQHTTSFFSNKSSFGSIGTTIIWTQYINKLVCIVSLLLRFKSHYVYQV